METSDDILTKQETYWDQMAPVREVVMGFADPRAWSGMSRGRRAHVSISGPVAGKTGAIDIEAEPRAWDAMPNMLTDGTLFTLWCSASVLRDGVCLHADTELFWVVDFEGLLPTVPRFLERGWGMLNGLDDSNFGPWPGPSRDPCIAPGFGPPRRRGQ